MRNSWAIHGLSCEGKSLFTNSVRCKICLLCLSVQKEKYALYVLKEYVFYVFLSKKKKYVLYVFLSKKEKYGSSEKWSDR